MTVYGFANLIKSARILAFFVDAALFEATLLQLNNFRNRKNLRMTFNTYFDPIY